MGIERVNMAPNPLLRRSDQINRPLGIVVELAVYYLPLAPLLNVRAIGMEKKSNLKNQNIELYLDRSH